MQPLTPEEFLAMTPAERTKFARSMGRVTPEVVALLVYTYVNTQMDAAEGTLFLESLVPMLEEVDPIELFVLAWRYINRSQAPPALLPAHQGMASVLCSQLPLGWHCADVRQMLHNGVERYYIGDLVNPIYPSNPQKLAAEGVKEGDGVLYKELEIVGGEYVATMVRVPMNNDLPATLGL